MPYIHRDLLGQYMVEMFAVCSQSESISSLKKVFQCVQFVLANIRYTSGRPVSEGHTDLSFLDQSHCIAVTAHFGGGGVSWQSLQTKFNF